MRKLAFRNLIFIVVVTLIIASLTFAYFFSNLTYENDVENIINELKIIDTMLAEYSDTIDIEEQTEMLASLNLKEDSRITIITVDGDVVADSSIAGELENHLDREEVQEALKTGEGSAIRYSGTLGYKMIYAAYYGESGYIIRMSAPSDGFVDYYMVLIPGIGISFLIAFALSSFLSKRLADKMAAPIESITNQLSSIREDNGLYVNESYQYAELNTIAQVTNRLTDKINETVDSLKEETKKIHYLLNQMSEGIIIMDDQKQVILINRVALQVLKGSTKENGKAIDEYTSNQFFLDFVNQKEKNMVLAYDDRLYAITKNEVNDDVFAGSTILLFIDVTEQKNNEKMKQMFFSNASHELKTPLTSIQGYTELLTNDLVVDEEMKKEILNKIALETKRMSRLINDILMISKLENDEYKVTLSIIQLRLLVEDVFNTLSPIASDRHISLINESEDFDFYGNLEHMNQILTNLLSNSIKYGEENGWVKLKIEKKKYGIKIVVRDNGIGIAQENIPHLTERFYRVNKGRTKTIEGTGLGLSIVKHIVQLYHGELDIQSELGKGTTVIVKLKISERKDES